MTTTRLPTFESPVPVSRTGPGGLQVVASRLASTPMVQAHLAIPVALSGPRDLAVVDVMTAAWGDTDEVRTLERLGGTAAVSRRRQWLIISVVGHAAHLPQLLDVLRGTVHAAYTADQVERARRAAQQQSRLIAAQPAGVSQTLLWQQVYDVPPTVLRPAPAPDELSEVGLDAVTLAHARHVTPEGSRVVVVGDVDEDAVVDVVHEALAGWTSPPQLVAGEAPVLRAGAPAVARHHRTDLAATHVRLAAPSLPVSHPEAFTTAALATLVLGGNFASRLNETVRETEGLAYRTSGYLNDQLDRVLLVVEADVTNGSAGAALGHVARILTDLADHGPTEQELERAVGFTLGSYELSLGSQNGRAACLLSYLTTGVALDTLATLPWELRSLTPADLRAVYQRFRPELVNGVVHGVCDDLPATDPDQKGFHHG